MKFKNIDEEVYDNILGILRKSYEYQEKYDDDFRKVLEACLNDYQFLVKEITIDVLFYALVVNNCYYMNRIVKSYLQGRHSTALAQLKNVLKTNRDLYVTEVSEGEYFYRMRCFGKRKDLSRKDIFHIPINKKRIIKTQRYSAPGYPCLYLGKSLYGCWEEMNRPNTEKTLVACFRSQKLFRALDLRIPTFDEFANNIERYLQIFPFIIACGVPVRNANDVYKPEYIMPQLLLEWIIDNNYTKADTIAGVYYTSANRNIDFYILDHEWDNLAIPVQDSLTGDAFCPKLKDLFWCTMPTCYEYELIRGNIDTKPLWENISNPDDPYGLKEDYNKSLFSRMESIIKKKTFNVVDTEELD